MKYRIQLHEEKARQFLQLASDNFAVAMHEPNGERKKEYLGYAEDYLLLAQQEMTKAYNLVHLSLQVSKS